MINPIFMINPGTYTRLRNHLNLENAPNISVISEEVLMGDLAEWEGVCSELQRQLPKKPWKASSLHLS